MTSPEINNTVFKSTVLLFGMTLLLKILGYVEKLVLAYYFGTSDAADVFVSILIIIMAFFFFFREIIEPVVLNKFMRAEQDEAWNLFNYVLRWIFVVTLVISTVIILAPEFIIMVLAPGFDNERMTSAITLLQLSAPAVIFLCLSTLTNIVLNAQKIFSFPLVGDLFFKLVMILSIVLFYKTCGLQSTAIGIFIGAVVKLVTHLFALHHRITFRLVSINAEAKRNLWYLSWPLMIGMLFSQLTSIVDNVFASYMTNGSIAALSYARKVIELPVVLFPYVLSVVIFPHFTELEIQQNSTLLYKWLGDILRWIILLFTPAAIFLALFSNEVVKFIFERGAFDPSSTAITSTPLSIYAIGLVFFGIEAILVNFYYARGRIREPVTVGIVTVMINILVTYLSIPHAGYLAIPIAFVIQKGMKVLILSVILKRDVEWHMKQFMGITSKILVSAVVFAGTLLTINRVFYHWFDDFQLPEIIAPAASLVVSGVIYLLILLKLGVINLGSSPHGG